MSDRTCALLVCLLVGMAPAAVEAQTNEHPAAPSSDAHAMQLEQKLETVTSALASTQQQLEQSQKQIRELQEEMLEIRKQLALGQPAGAAPGSSGGDAAKTMAADIEDLKERQQAVEAQVAVHDQTKVESASRYPVRVTGLILFNAFENRGRVDVFDVPGYALRASDTGGAGGGGASLRQTILGIEGSGPRIGGARTFADVNIDFFGGQAAGIGTSAGVVRMRTASINMEWKNDSLQAGFVGPLISPLSPNSYARVAEPAMAGAGNLWIWAPQLRYAHTIPFQNTRHVQLEFGLWDPPLANYNSTATTRVAGPGEQSKQPGYETRVSYGTADAERGFQVGVSGYYSRQNYPYGARINSWAGTIDWRVPLGSRFEVSGEGYRGLALGGLGGGGYKDTLYGADPVSGTNYYRGLSAAGGWTQLKTRFAESLEANAAFGMDDGFAGDFHAVVLPSGSTAAQLLALNRMVTGNLIFRPKTSLILSPEYRRIWTWQMFGAATTADIFTLSAGYQF